jgi:hypothetical protein
MDINLEINPNTLKQEKVYIGMGPTPASIWVDGNLGNPIIRITSTTRDLISIN